MPLPRFARSLSARLLLLTILFVMLAEVLIYLPSVARFRMEWMSGRLGDAHLAALAIEAAPDAMVSDDLERELLRHVGAYAVDVEMPGMNVLMLAGDGLPEPQARYDLATAGVPELIVESLRLIVNATLSRQASQRVIRITGPSPADPAVRVTVLLREAPLCHDLLAYSGRILVLSLMISLITAGLVYVTLIYMTVRPMRRLADAMMAFKRDPESAEPALALATDRTDEVGVAQRELIAMQEAVRQALRQRQRLATLGTAVAKINHDIRGVLASATLLSERLLDSDDPEVRRTGPRILASLERAAMLCTQTLTYSRDSSLPLHREPVDLTALVDEAGQILLSERRTAAGGARPDWRNHLAPGTIVMADRDQLLRVLLNLGRNALESGATMVRVQAVRDDERLTVTVADDGPGLAPRARENLFQPFAASTKANGTGLGLSIVQEILRIHGGEIRLERTGADGTVFALCLPATG